MKHRARIASVIIVMVLAVPWGWQSSHAQTPGQLYFQQTGHWVVGDFLREYQKVADPLLLYGYPITDAFQSPITGTYVQYFQRARFEMIPGATGEDHVILSPLGFYMYVPGTPQQTLDNPAACRSFSNGHQVCLAFLDFFEAHGGVEQFGEPISNFEIQDDRIVQYFERARFEWHPDFPSGQRVRLSDLGRRYFDFQGENPIRLLPNPGNNTVPTVLSLRVRAFAGKAITPIETMQTVYVVVQDQNWQPVANAQPVMNIELPSGERGQYILPTTDEHGVTQYPFSFKAQGYGIASIKITVTYNGLEAGTTTSFRVWW